MSLPLSGAAWNEGIAWIRLSGGPEAIQSAAKKIGSDHMVLHNKSDEGSKFWMDLKEQNLDFFKKPGDLWRLSLPAASPAELTDFSNSSFLYDWLGALRWIKSRNEGQIVREKAESAGGHAVLFRKDPDSTASQNDFCALNPGILKMHKRLKNIFDPGGILNPGRMHPEF